MRNIKLTLAYDGTDFHGWQVQSGKPTVQGALNDVVRKITQEKLTVYGAGRTDAGVHALGQVAHFKTSSALSPGEFQRALNALLPPAVRVVAAEEVGPDFHARWQAQAKTYLYRIFRGRVVPPFAWRYVLHYPYPLDEPAMQAAAKLFEGEHDFTSFAASAGSEDDDRERTTLRQVFRSECLRLPVSAVLATLPLRPSAPWFSGPDASPFVAHVPAGVPAGAGRRADVGYGDELVYLVRGRSFLRYMVRKMVGTLLEVGRGRLAPADIPRLFELRDRSKSGPTVPPHGLFLVAVEYPEPWRLDAESPPAGR
jgi:tRNA pseudouridine38-40 synthase